MMMDQVVPWALGADDTMYRGGCGLIVNAIKMFNCIGSVMSAWPVGS